ncbi:MAG: FHA domain-containing protein [Rhodospirillaceae bacterium]|jgi:adenylate cyclase|nr:FHA domain-containing protein [Rhodospirillaceae bacterium]MBT6118934.1 FHA domain-containing protein [Rhodospirillaceae bacterium]
MSETQAPASGALEAGWRLFGHDAEGNPVTLLVGDTLLRRAHPGIAVGRHPALCDLVIGHPTISARHFRLSAGGDSVYVEDLNSLNGTIVDDRRLAPYEAAAISDGSAVVAGGVALRVERLEG